MTRAWVALLDEPAADAECSVPVQVRGQGSAVLVSWTGKHHPHPRAMSIDPRALGRGGPPMSISWVELERDRRPLFDAPEVLEARRVLLRDWPSYGASTMVADDVHLAGAVVLQRPRARVSVNPFAGLGPARVLLAQGFFLAVPRPTGPAVERYAGMPWPYDRFPGSSPAPRRHTT